MRVERETDDSNAEEKFIMHVLRGKVLCLPYNCCYCGDLWIYITELGGRRHHNYAVNMSMHFVQTIRSKFLDEYKRC